MRALTLLLPPLIGLVLACSSRSSTEGPTPTAPLERITAAPIASSTAPAASATAAPSPAAGECGRSLLTAGSADATELAKEDGRIAFVCEGDIWTMRPDGGDQRRLTTQPTIAWDRVRLYRVPETAPPSADERRELERAMNSSPRWLSGGAIAFASIRDTLQLSANATDNPRFFVGASEVYTTNADGSGERRVTSYNLTPGSYSPDDRTGCPTPAFCFAGLLTISPTSTSKADATIVVDIVEIRFSECCFYTRLLRIMPARTELASTEGVVANIPPGEVRALDWSASGTSFVVQRSINLGGGGQNTELWRYTGASRDLLLTAGPQETLVAAGSPAIAPDGQTVAFCGWQSAREPPALFTVRAGAAPRMLVTMSKRLSTGTVLSFVDSQECAPRWSADGRYLTTATGDGDIAVVEAASGRLVRVARGGQPDWSP